MQQLSASSPERARANWPFGAQAPAIHRQRRAGDERGLVRQQEERGVGDLLRPRRAAHRVLASPLGDKLLGVEALGALLVGAGDEDAQHWRVGGAGADDVDPHAVLGNSLGERAGKADDAELHRGVDRAELRALEPGGRGRVEQAAAAARLQLGQGGFRGDDLRAQVEVDGERKVRHVDALDRRRPRVAEMVPHEVEAAEGVRRLAHDALGVGVLAQIGRDADGPPAGGRDLLHHGIDAGAVEVDHGDARAFPGKAEHAGTAHARAGSRDDADLVLQPHGFPPLTRRKSAIVRRRGMVRQGHEIVGLSFA